MRDWYGVDAIVAPACRDKATDSWDRVGGTTLAIIALAGAAASIYSANQQSGAASDAAGAQIGASKEALAQQQANFERTYKYAQDQYNQQRADQAPWLRYGRGAVTMLGDLMGVKPNDSPDMLGLDATKTPNPNPPDGPGPNSGHGPDRNPPYTPPAPGDGGADSGLPGRDNPGGPGRRSVLGPVQDSGGPAPNGQQTSRSTVGGSTVRITWPDGSTNEVPEKDLPAYQQLGAQVAH